MFKVLNCEECGKITDQLFYRFPDDKKLCLSCNIKVNPLKNKSKEDL